MADEKPKRSTLARDEAEKARKAHGMLGKKNALGNDGGRPRSFEPAVEAEALVKWAKTEEALVLRKFACLRGYAPSRMDDWIIDNSSFREAYAIAKHLIGSRLQEILINGGSSKPFDRYADIYDDNLLAHEQSKERFAADIKARADINEKKNLVELAKEMRCGRKAKQPDKIKD